MTKVYPGKQKNDAVLVKTNCYVLQEVHNAEAQNTPRSVLHALKFDYRILVD
jgi:hypothetical protein